MALKTSAWRAERNRKALARLTKALPAIFPAPVLTYALKRAFIPPMPRLAIDGYWRAHPLRADLPGGHHLRPIREADTAIDYPAVMGSRERLWAKYGDAWGWPAATIARASWPTAPGVTSMPRTASSAPTPTTSAACASPPRPPGPVDTPRTARETRRNHRGRRRWTAPRWR